MAKTNPEDAAGAQLAMLAALAVLLRQYRGNEAVAAALKSQLEHMHALLLAAPTEERKLVAFDAAAESLLEAVRAAPAESS